MGKISVIDAVMEGNRIWMLDGCTNGIFCLDLAGGDIEYKVNLDSGLGNQLEYGTMVKYNGLYLMFPIFSSNMAVYVLGTQKCSYIPLPELFLNLPSCNTRGSRIAFAHLHKKRIYAFGADYPGILSVEPDTWNIQCISLEYAIHDILKDASNGYFSYCYAADHQMIYIPVRSTNYICEFNADTMECRVIDTKRDAAYEGCCMAEGRIWLVHSREARVTIWDPKEDAFEEFFIEELKEQEFEAPDIHCIGEHVCIHTTNYCITVGVRDRKVSFRQLQGLEKGFCREKVFEQRIYRFTVGNMSVWKLGHEAGEASWTALELDSGKSAEIYEDLMNREKEAGVVHTENYFFGLKELAAMLQQRNAVSGSPKNMVNRQQKSVGKAVYDMVCSSIEKQGGR